jgi:hypothetical protein
MNRGLLRLWPIVLLIVAAGVGVILIAPRRPHSAKQQGPRAGSSATATATIEASGEILGVRIGSTFEEARAKLDPLRDPASDTIREKKEPGRRKTYWKLAHPEYSWIMVRPNRKGRITQISVFLKPETPKPFDQIGDLKRAATHHENMAVWNVDQPNNLSYRLVAKGANGRATNVILIATSLE